MKPIYVVDVKKTKKKHGNIFGFVIHIYIYIYEDNEYTINEIAEESIYWFGKQLEDNNQNEEIEILRKYNFDFIRLLEQPSIVLRGKSRIWEILRGVYNDNFNKLTNKKEELIIIKCLWNFIYEEYKKRIWIPRCDRIAEIERKEDIKKLDLRRKRDVKNEGKSWK